MSEITSRYFPPLIRTPRFEARVMLDHLGIPVKDQPTKTSEAKALLEGYRRNDLETYRKAYAIVVDKDFGAAAQAPVKVMNYTDASQLLRTEIKTQFPPF